MTNLVVMVNANANNVENLMVIFMWFEGVSGLQVNITKTTIFPVNEVIHRSMLPNGEPKLMLSYNILRFALGATFKSRRGGTS